MKRIALAGLLLVASGCVSTQCDHSPAPAGMPLLGATASVPSTGAACDALPALGMGWETITIRIPKPRLLAVPRPVAAPQVVGVPILTGAPAMTMATAAPMMAAPMMAAPMMAAPMMAAQPAARPAQSQAAPAAPQSQPTPQNCCPDPGCADGCAEGCGTQASIQQECEALMHDISCLQQELSVQTSHASVQMRN
jgi:hypothetical protein